MKRDELKKIIDEVLETDSIIDAIAPSEVAVYTKVWTITYKQIESIRERGINVLSIYIEGYHLSIRVKL